MPSHITREQVSHVAYLSRLAITDEEVAQYAEQLSKVLDHARDIEALALDGVEPMAHPLPLSNVLREDIQQESLDPASFLAMAPESQEGMFHVPKIIGEAP